MSARRSPLLLLLPLAAPAAAILLTGCGREEPAGTLAPPDPDPIVQADDPEMEAAVREARRNVYVLTSALQGAGERPRAVSVKVAVKDGDAVETLTLTDVHLENGNLVGRIDDPPMRVQNVQMGQQYSVVPHEVVDWFIIRGDQMQGGYTFRVMRSRLDPEQRAELDSALGVHFDDPPVQATP